ncbi:MAG: carbonate dehydratase [Acidobacteria bacterium]|nr:carbonate dehydratase [Acidobacteriota bacterium]
MERITRLLKNNKEWAAEQLDREPEFFANLAALQAPEYLWIGCSDSRVPANQITGLTPGDVFVHRNISNIVAHGDLNCLSVLQFAVEVLKVEHVIVCGHYGCGGVRAALESIGHGLIDNWLQLIRETAYLYSDELDNLEGEERVDRLCELNVARQVINAADTTVVTDAWARGQKLIVHGWIYGLRDGIIHDLGFVQQGPDDAQEFRERFLKKKDLNMRTAA